MKLYFEAEKFLKPSKNSGSLQSRIFNDSKLTNSPKHIFAVVYSTLKYKEYILEIIRKSKIKQQLGKTKISDELLMLLIHDYLFSAKGRIQSGKHPIKEAFLKHKTRIHAELTKLKLKYKVKNVTDLPTQEADDDETPVRWFRINTIKASVEKVSNYEWFKNLQPVSAIQDIKQSGPGVIYHDEHIPNLYGVHPREKITSTEAYTKGEIIIQDRASCFPAHILNFDLKHRTVIDACAAPGNKTSHCAAYLSTIETEDEKPVVYAFERDSKRVKILKAMSEKATGIKNQDLIQITHADFTSTKPSDFDTVTGFVVDPSCSGSGIFGRALEDEEQSNQDIDTERLNKLAGFQFKIVKHALLFPSAQKVVYSTCSIHPHENERVVVDLLQDPQIKELGWKLDVRENVVPSWPRRGWKEEFTAIADGDEEQMSKLAGGCVRAVPKEDGGIGFFAASFVKSK